VNKIFKVLSLGLFYAVLLNGCEDDPVLSPQAESDDSGGSYGKLSLPAQDNNVKNPEIF
tara:strand:+ start:599 stop:775 length:177 start_codon:yes stop_codon:yes gene_type:complete